MSLDPTDDLLAGLTTLAEACPDVAAVKLTYPTYRRTSTGQVVTEDGFLARNFVRVYLDLHVWVVTRAGALDPVKAIFQAFSTAWRGKLPVLSNGTCIDLKLSRTRYMLDPKGDLAHGILTVDALVELPL